MENKFNIGDTVYHITPDSPSGIILNIRYYFRTNEYEYFIVWSHENSSYCIEDEISINKKF